MLELATDWFWLHAASVAAVAVGLIALGIIVYMVVWK